MGTKKKKSGKAKIPETNPEEAEMSPEEAIAVMQFYNRAKTWEEFERLVDLLSLAETIVNKHPSGIDVLRWLANQPVALFEGGTYRRATLPAAE